METTQFTISTESQLALNALSLLHQFDGALFDVICPDGEPTTKKEKYNFDRASKLVGELNGILNECIIDTINANITSTARYDTI